MRTLTLDKVTYTYDDANKAVLKGISATFESGKIYTIVGKSGSGKSTLLSLMAGLDICRGGEILFDNSNLKEIDRDKYRARGVGVIFQSFNLITNASAVENIMLSLHISGNRKRAKKAHAYALLDKVGINREKADRKVLKLSGGEQQRVGIARALSHEPALIIADEPTGNLDKETASEILDILTSLAHDEGKCVVIVTHSMRVTAIADKILNMKSGHLSAVK